jgi:hypothetical protein
VGPACLDGRDADERLRELAAVRHAARPVLGRLARRLVEERLHERLGYRCLGDYAREHLGVGARAVREWARVWRALEELPRLRRAVVAGEVSWAVARRVVSRVTAETEKECLATVRGRTLRAVDAILRAVAQAETRLPGGSLEPGSDSGESQGDEEVVRVRLACTGGEWRLWRAAEAIAAEGASAMGAAAVEEGRPAADGESGPDGDVGGAGESGLRHRAFPQVGWHPSRSPLPARLARLVEGLDHCSPREVDRRIRAVVAFLQSLDLDYGRVLRQMVDARLFAEIGFPGLARYAQERLDCSPRTARRLVALARSERRVPGLANVFQRGTLHALQAQAVARVADAASAGAWIARARAVSYRRLAQDTGAFERAEISFRAPREVAKLFLGMLGRAGSLARLLGHAIAAWLRHGAQFRDYADFERDGYRCVVPGCTARRGLESHHRWYRSQGGPDVPWNRVTLCHGHHRRGVHAGNLWIHGRAPDALTFELGSDRGEWFWSGDLRLHDPTQPGVSVSAARHRYQAATLRQGRQGSASASSVPGFGSSSSS